MADFGTRIDPLAPRPQNSSVPGHSLDYFTDIAIGDDLFLVEDNWPACQERWHIKQGIEAEVELHVGCMYEHCYWTWSCIDCAIAVAEAFADQRAKCYQCNQLNLNRHIGVRQRPIYYSKLKTNYFFDQRMQ